MGRKKKDPIISIPQEGKPLVDSTNTNNVQDEQISDIDSEDILEIDSDSSIENEELQNPDDENDEFNPIQEESPNVIVLRAFDLGDIHYSPLRKYFIDKEHIPELLENQKLKLICKHG